MKIKEGIYTVAYAYPTSPNAVKMGRPQRGAWYIGYAKDRITPNDIIKGPFDLRAQAEEALEDLHKENNTIGGTVKSQQAHRLTCGYTCPSCGSDEIDAAGFDEDGDGGVYRKRSCSVCQAVWVDHYDLSGYSMLTE